MYKNILTNISHRSWPLPEKQWSYYQEWNNSLFLHWKIPVEDLQRLIPENLTIDLFENEAWVSLVAFTMENIRPKNLPSISFISNFHEINLRTYVIKDKKPGVYFLSIEAGKYLSVLISKNLSGLPYRKSAISRTQNENQHFYISKNDLSSNSLQAHFSIGEKIKDKTLLDKWLTERYCLYFDYCNELYRYQIHHKEWELNNVEIKKLTVNYSIGDILLNNTPALIHYSPGVKVITWKKEKLL